MAPRKTSVKKSPVKRKSTTTKKSSSMVKKSTPKTILKKHGKKLATLGLATLLAGAGAAELKYRKGLTYGGAGPTRLEAIKSLFSKKQ